MGIYVFVEFKQVKMKLLVLLLFYLLVHAKAQIRAGQNTREAGRAQFPYAVQIHYRNFGCICTGSILGHRWVITAAHCVRERIEEGENWYNENRRGIYVVAGDIATKRFRSSHPFYGRNQNYHEERKSFNAKHIIHHPDFDNDPLADLALIFLQGRIVFSNRRQRVPLPLPLPRGRLIRKNDQCTIMGWGYTAFKWLEGNDKPIQTTPSIFLRHDNVTVGLILRKRFYFYQRAGGVRTMKGDSGGPLICTDSDGQKKLFGVLKGALYDDDRASLESYVRLENPDYRNWIDRIMSDEDYYRRRQATA